MLVLITYDVNTSDAAGRGRLRRIAKECVNYGQRVQNSVFECLLDTAQCRKLQNELCKIIDPEKDSLRCNVTRSVSKMTEIERRGGKRWDKPKKAEKSRDCGGGKF